MDLLERKGLARASRSVSRKVEGFGGFAQPGKAFAPLGAPQELERLNSKLQKDPKQRGFASSHSGAHHESKSHDGTLDGGDGERGLEHSRNADGSDASAERKRAQLADLPHGLFGKDLPRCTMRRHVADGFDSLRQSIRRSDQRMRQVKHDAAEGLDLPTAGLEAALPTREHYCHEGSSTARTIVVEPSAPLDIRIARPPLSSRGPPTRSPFGPGPMKENAAGAGARSPPSGHKLPSLADVLTSSGAPGSSTVGGAAQAGYEGNAYTANRCREQIEKLLSYGLSGTGMGHGDRPRAKELAARKGQEVDRWKRMEKVLEKRERDFWEKVPPRVAGHRPAQHDADAQRTLEGDAAEDGLGLGGGTADRGPGGLGAEQAPGASGGGERIVDEVVDGAERRRARGGPEDIGVGGAGGAISSARGARDAADAPVVRLRSALHAYQEVRDRRREHLRSTLQAAETNRPNTWRKFAAASGSPRAGEARQSDEGAQQAQLRQYHDLLTGLREEGEKVPAVGHFMLDTVRTVLEHGQAFQADHLHTMLAKVGDDEMDRVVAGIVMRIATSMCAELTGHDILQRLEQCRRQVPQPFRDVLVCSGADDVDMAV